RGLADGEDGAQGVYSAFASGFPDVTFNSANYWVDVVFSPSLAVDIRPPTISAIQATGITMQGATIGWTTDEASDSQIEYGTTTAYVSATTLTTAPVTAHSQALTGLAPATPYHYRVKNRDAPGNLATSGDFTIPTLPDTTAPVISGVQATAITATTATITWTTDEPADSQVVYGQSSTPLDPAPVTSHSVLLTGLTPATTYSYQ